MQEEWLKTTTTATNDGFVVNLSSGFSSTETYIKQWASRKENITKNLEVMGRKQLMTKNKLRKVISRNDSKDFG